MRRVALYSFITLVAFLVTYILLSSESGRAFMAQVRGEEAEVQRLLGSNPCEIDESSFDCWDDHYARVIAQQGPRIALLELKARYEQGGYPRTYCHALLHPIGRAAGAKYGSVAEAYKHGDTFCRSGYYHGVLEGIFGANGADALLENLDAMCAEVEGKDRYSYDYFSCVHGVGHGLMAYFDHDLFQSIAACDQLSGEWEQSSCHGGVFMENVISDTEKEPSRFLKDDDPLYPCNAVDDRYRYQCYLMQTSHMLTLYNGNFGMAFAVCSSVEEKHRTPCYQSLGRDASGWSYGSIDEVLRYCQQGMTPEQESQCLVGAAADFIQSYGVEEARRLCEHGGETRQACSEAVESQVRYL